MDIICKCGHEHGHHDTGYLGCDANMSSGHVCQCALSEAEVLLIYITEQQARLDTNRAQVEALMSEKDALKKENQRMADKFLRIIDEIYDIDTVIRICNDAIKEFVNGQ